MRVSERKEWREGERKGEGKRRREEKVPQDSVP